MTECGTLRQSLLALGVAVFVAAFGAQDARAEITFPSQLPKTSEALTAIVKAVPGLSAAGFKDFKVTGNSANSGL